MAAHENEDQSPDIEHDDEESGGKSGKKMGLIIIIAVVLLLGGAGAAYFLGALDGLLGKHEEEATEETAHGEEGSEAGAPVVAKITYYELPEFLVNLSSSTNQTSFLKMRVILELPSEEALLVAQEKLPVLQDHFNTYLRDLRASDLAGSAGTYRLREELLMRANKSLEPIKVNNILFKEILVQ